MIEIIEGFFGFEIFDSKIFWARKFDENCIFWMA